MGHTYRAVGWNRNKAVYDRALVLGIATYLLLFVGAGFAFHPEATAETLLIRAFGTSAFVLLHVILAIGPLARLDARFLPLLYNRRHLGVATFVVGLAHGLFALLQFHALGNMNPLVSVLSANPRLDSVSQFPFQPLGLAALVILFLMAATSHDFWLTNLTAPVWKALHMLVYVAWGLLVLHVALGVLQAETNALYVLLIGGGTALVAALHVAAALRERRTDRPFAGPSTGADDDAGDAPGAAAARWVDVCGVDDIPEKRALIVTLAGERVAVFRYDGRISVLSNVCQHQNGPLGEGRIIDGLVTCPWHGYQYEPRCGRSPAPFDERVPTFEARVVDGRVLVDPLPLSPGTDIEPARIDGEQAPAASGEFFVGYLAHMPAGVARFVGSRVRAVLGASALLAILISAIQAPFGTAVFEYGEERAFEGWIQSIPYPTLLVSRPGRTGDEPRFSRWLLAGLGKFGADDEVAGLEGRHVRLRGTLVYRDDRTMIELVPHSSMASGRDLPLPEPVRPGEDRGAQDLGLHTFVGEIVDSKCFLGVMKPGNLKPHRACATRCIAGGVPPVLLVRRDDGTALYLLLTSSDGRAVNDAVLDKIAEPLEITGRVLRYDDLLVLRADPETYARLER